MRWLLLIIFCATVSTRAVTLFATNSLQEAITAAREGDTIIVQGPAVFRENIIIEKSLRLLGTNSPVLDGGMEGTVLLIKAPGVIATGLLVRNSGANLAGFDSAIRVESSGTTIANCRLENHGFGIFIRGADNTQVRDNTITGSDIPSTSTPGNGIHLWKTKGNQVARNIIRGKRDGIYLSYADKNLITGNSVEQSRFGIHYMYSHYNTLQSNSLSGNTVGATLMFARHCQVEGNRVQNNKRHGILLKQFESSVLKSNYISGHNRGLFVQQAAQDRFEDNVIAHNDIGLYLSSGSEQNVFVGNSFVKNVDQVWQPPDEVERGRQADNAFFERGTGNFWSDYTGADRNHDGLGDTPYHETDLYGYLLDRHPEARVFALSPAAALLRKGEELLPLINVAGVSDLFPLITPAKKNLYELPAKAISPGQ